MGAALDLSEAILEVYRLRRLAAALEERLHIAESDADQLALVVRTVVSMEEMVAAVDGHDRAAALRLQVLGSDQLP